VPSAHAAGKTTLTFATAIVSGDALHANAYGCKNRHRQNVRKYVREIKHRLRDQFHVNSRKQAAGWLCDIFVIQFTRAPFFPATASRSWLWSKNADGFPAYTRHKFSFDRLRCKFEQTGDLRRA
jgi:hypothetical protein